MLHFLDFARQMTPLAVTLRMVSAVICGGLVGIEREFKRRPAGFRTHILICLGASVTILTNLYLYQVMHLYTDISRMGAQAIAGIGFIGAGTIIVTKRNEIKGLTTAATLWSTACMGIAVGVGFYECAMIMYVLLIIILVFVSVLDKKYLKIPTSTALYLEVRKEAGLGDAIEYIHDVGWNIREVKEFPSGREDVLAVRMDLESDNALRGDVSAIKLLSEQPDVLRLEM